MKKKPTQHENHERWLVSYADFITLLFAFFVVMFASSQTDKGRAKQISEAVEKALEQGKTVGLPAAVAKILGGTVDDRGQGNAMMKGPGGAQHATKESPPEEMVELLPSMKRLSQELESEVKDGKLEIHLEPRGLVVSLREATFFPSGTDEVDTTSYAVLDKVAAAIKDLPNPVSFEGHTDSVPIHTGRFRNNWDLSAARSVAMLGVFSQRYNITPERLSVVGHADTIPLASNDTPEGRARNRRVDVVIKNLAMLKRLEPNKLSPASAGPKK
jgi:chemotaxis protein MotB